MRPRESGVMLIHAMMLCALLALIAAAALPRGEALTRDNLRTGAELVAEQHPDGHHWHNWRDRLGAALAHTVRGGDPTRIGSVES